VLLDHGSSVFVVPEPDKLRMPEPVSVRPLKELNLSNGLRTKPDAFLDFLGDEFIAPSGLVSVRQVNEGHRRRNKMTDFLEHLAT